eukprot:5446635-Amphidinium_carterae.1
MIVKQKPRNIQQMRVLRSRMFNHAVTSKSHKIIGYVKRTVKGVTLAANMAKLHASNRFARHAMARRSAKVVGCRVCWKEQDIG